MSDTEIKELTEQYNEKRKSFSFPTISASENAIKSVLKMDPGLEHMEQNILIQFLAKYFYDLAFNW